MHKFLSLCWILCTVLLTAGAGPADPRLGWHGEKMPEGLSRGKTQGEYVWKKDGTIMVYVPPGAFTMGSDKGEPSAKPVHTVELDGFYIDKFEVSWRRWKESGLPYLTEPDERIQKPQPPDWGLHDAQPIVLVTWHEAKRYAAWAGKRLPTEAEWEKAARGTDGRTYPWGEEAPTYDRAMWVDHPLSGKSTAPVNCCAPGASPYGVLNLAGNVWEWCEDTYQPDFYARSPKKNPVNVAKGDLKILRGGALQLGPTFMRTFNRYWLLDVDRISDIGFRTALSAAP